MLPAFYSCINPKVMVDHFNIPLPFYLTTVKALWNLRKLQRPQQTKSTSKNLEQCPSSQTANTLNQPHSPTRIVTLSSSTIMVQTIYRISWPCTIISRFGVLVSIPRHTQSELAC